MENCSRGDHSWPGLIWLTEISTSSQLLFGLAIRDLLPVRPGQYTPAETWINLLEQRELVLRQKVSLGAELVWVSTCSCRTSMPQGT